MINKNGYETYVPARTRFECTASKGTFTLLVSRGNWCNCIRI